MIEELTEEVDPRWHDRVLALRWPSSEVAARQAVWDAAWDPAYQQGLTAGMSPGKAAMRAWRLTRMRHGPRPEDPL